MFLRHKREGARSSARPILPWWLVGSVAVGTLLNPLNSSMIAVALVSLGAAFHVSLLTATWLVSSFYLAGAAGHGRRQGEVRDGQVHEFGRIRQEGAED